MVIVLPERINVDDALLEDVCGLNPDWRIEREADGKISFAPPAHSGTGRRGAEIVGQLFAWNRRAGGGVVFDAEAGFTLPNTAVRAPDASWMSRERWNTVSASERESFAHVVPHFAIELRSAFSSLAQQQAKMREYIANGVDLAWLIDPKRKMVEIWGLGGSVQTLRNPADVRGEGLLAGFTLDVSDIFDVP